MTVPKNEPISVPTESRQPAASWLKSEHYPNVRIEYPTTHGLDESATLAEICEAYAASSSLLPVPEPEVQRDNNRCAICAWPLIEGNGLNPLGCVRGNCSLRPHPEKFYDFDRAEKEYGATFDPRYRLASLPVGESPRALSELELRAIAFAAKAHSCQVDKAGHSYLAHPFRVAMAVRSEGEKYFAVGMLHDVPEDTDATLAEITAEFGPEIGEAVDSLTRRKATSSYESDVIRAMTNPIGRKVKQADVADNERPERIGLLEPATQDRLRKKYAIAHRVFKEVADLGLGESREPLPPK